MNKISHHWGRIRRKDSMTFFRQTDTIEWYYRLKRKHQVCLIIAVAIFFFGDLLAMHHLISPERWVRL